MRRTHSAPARLLRSDTTQIPLPLAGERSLIRWCVHAVAAKLGRWPHLSDEGAGGVKRSRSKPI